MRFPFLFGGTFIEGAGRATQRTMKTSFPFLFGGTFIEGRIAPAGGEAGGANFPSFSEGLSLRGH